MADPLEKLCPCFFRPKALERAQRIRAAKEQASATASANLSPPPLPPTALAVDDAPIEALPPKIEYASKGALLSPAEYEFFRVLNRVCKGRGVFIAVQVRLADVLMAPQGSGHQAAFNRIAKKHLDFVICDARNAAILGAIELDDSSHNQKKRQERDTFVDEALASAVIPFYRLTVSVSYDEVSLHAVLDAMASCA